MKTQLGFTLLELAIVLAVLGLLLGGILKWQEAVDPPQSSQPVPTSPRST